MWNDEAGAVSEVGSLHEQTGASCLASLLDDCAYDARRTGGGFRTRILCGAAVGGPIPAAPLAAMQLQAA